VFLFSLSPNFLTWLPWGLYHKCNSLSVSSPSLHRYLSLHVKIGPSPLIKKYS
jgi:hypothetical protein